MSADVANEIEVQDEEVHDASYQPPPEKTIEEIMAADQEDESLRRYKEALLGAAQAEKIIVGMEFISLIETILQKLIKLNSINYYYRR